MFDHEVGRHLPDALRILIYLGGGLVEGFGVADHAFDIALHLCELGEFFTLEFGLKVMQDVY